MTTATTERPLDLIPTHVTGWRMGLGNLIGKEFGQWWRTRLWWIQTLIWVLLLNGVSTITMLDRSDTTPESLFDGALQTFFLVSATAVGIGIVITLQGSIVGEKELGTAAWVMSKPASRPAFVVSKLIANFTGFVVTSLLIPAALFLLAASQLLEKPIDLGDFGIGMAVLAFNILFYVTFTLALGSMFKGRGPVAGIGIGLVLFGQLLKGGLPEMLVVVTPWMLGEIATSFPTQVTPEFDWVTVLIAVGIETLVFGWLALWRFGREEF